jgi:hypothetical protein
VSAASLRALRAALRSEPGLLGELAQQGSPAGVEDHSCGPAQIAASGPRTASAAERYELLVELILEGSLLHYGEPRVIDPDDADLGLLLGDQLYALGLTRLAELGDLDAVRELADVISLIAQAALGGREQLFADIWRAGAAAVGWGGDLRHEQAKALARAGREEAGAALHEDAERRLEPRAGLRGDATLRRWR